MQQDQAVGMSAIGLNYNQGAQVTSLTNPNLPAATADSSYAYTADGQRCWSHAATTITYGPSCGSAPAGSTSYQWDARGQLCWSGQSTSTAPCAAPPTGVMTYSYSGDGLRMKETPPSGSQLSFSWDMVDGGSIPLMLDDGTNAYIYGTPLFGGTAPVEQINLTTQTPTVSFLASIPSGVQDVFSSTGAVQEQAAYSTYGNQVIESGGIVSPFGFQGSYTDASKLIYLINRYYDPNTYQFLSVDPKVATTLQPYAFVGGDPLNATDPLGLQGGPICSRSHGQLHCNYTRHRARRGVLWHAIRRAARAAGAALLTANNSAGGAIDRGISRGSAHAISAMTPVSNAVNKIPGTSWINSHITASCVVGATVTATAFVETGGAESLFLAANARIGMAASRGVVGTIAAGAGCAAPPEPP
jgi:RHS repeat-associated protein